MPCLDWGIDNGADPLVRADAARAQVLLVAGMFPGEYQLDWVALAYCLQDLFASSSPEDKCTPRHLVLESAKEQRGQFFLHIQGNDTLRLGIGMYTVSLHKFLIQRNIRQEKGK